MKKFGKILALCLALAMVVACFTACGDKTPEEGEKEAAAVKVGFIFLHDEQSTYDKNFMDAAKKACEEMGVEYAQKTQIPENKDCYDAAVDLIETDGCNVIFADSFGHESFLIEAAKKYPDVQFCHATGTQAHTAGVANFHNAFASIYQGRYLAGVAAGLKLNEMIEAGKITADKAKMGYVGAFTFAEVMSGYTSFYLGAKSVCPTVTMDVKKAVELEGVRLRKTKATVELFSTDYTNLEVLLGQCKNFKNFARTVLTVPQRNGQRKTILISREMRGQTTIFQCFCQCSKLAHNLEISSDNIFHKFSLLVFGIFLSLSDYILPYRTEKVKNFFGLVLDVIRLNPYV